MKVLMNFTFIKFSFKIVIARDLVEFINLQKSATMRISITKVIYYVISKLGSTFRRTWLRK